MPIRSRRSCSDRRNATNAGWALSFFAIWISLSQSPISTGSRRLSSAARTEAAEMTTPAAANHQILPQIQNEPGNDSFRPLISLGKTTNVPWQSRCLVEADISKEGLYVTGRLLRCAYRRSGAGNYSKDRKNGDWPGCIHGCCEAG